MRGASVHLAPFGGVGMSMRQSSRAGTSMVNAIHLPSGDHSRLLGVSDRRVNCVTAPSASIHRTKICAFSAVGPVASGAFVNAIRVPSGDHFGVAPLTRKRARVPSAFMIHSDDSHRWSLLSTH